MDRIPKELEVDYCNLLRRFDCLSVREEKGAELIKNICGLNAKVVLDPTLLLEDKEWLKLSVDPKIEEIIYLHIS